MKIGFPLDTMDTKEMAESFHGNDYLGIADIKNNFFESISIEASLKEKGKTDLLSLLKQMEVKIIICKKIQPVALKFFNENLITVYMADGEDIVLNTQLLKEGKLKRYLPNMIENVACSSGCSSCNSATCQN